MIEISEDDGRIMASVRHENGSVNRVDVTSLFIEIAGGGNLLYAIKKAVSRLGRVSQLNAFRELRNTIGIALHDLGILCLPRKESEWQRLLLEVYEYYFRREDIDRNLESRVKTWNSITVNTLSFLRDIEGVIPLGVDIPKAPNKLQIIDRSSFSGKLIGESVPEKVSGEVGKLLVDVSLSRTDAAYLEEVRDTLAIRRKRLHGFLSSWWEQISSHYKYGQRLVSKIDWDDKKEELDELIRKRKLNFSTFCSGHTESSLANQLAILKYEHQGYFNNSICKKSPYLPSYNGRYQLPDEAPSIINGVKKRRRVQWMQGNLTSFDVVMCCSLLTMLNPRFSPFSLLEAKIADSHGKTYLEIGDGKASFRINKNRAKSMKEEQLDPLSLSIIKKILEMTEPARKRLIDSGAPSSEYLFLTLNGKRDDHRAINAMNLSSYLLARSGEENIYRYFPELGDLLPDGTISMSKIRATEGVLEWFRTGSLTKMSKKLGNSYRVALEHYLPSPLLAAWNTRMVRRFQNLWIIAAVAEEDYLLEATDFKSIEELHAFVVDMLKTHASTSSPLADHLRTLFGERLKEESSNSWNGYEKGIFSVSVSKNVLIALYLYQELIIDAGLTAKELDEEDTVSKISPRSIANLAELLKHELPNRSESSLRKAHIDAIKEIPNWRSRINWGELVAKKEERYVY